MDELTPGPAVECVECGLTSVGATEAAYLEQECPTCGGYASAVEIAACPERDPDQCLDPAHDFGSAVHVHGPGSYPLA